MVTAQQYIRIVPLRLALTLQWRSCLYLDTHWQQCGHRSPGMQQLQWLHLQQLLQIYMTMVWVGTDSKCMHACLTV